MYTGPQLNKTVAVVNLDGATIAEPIKKIYRGNKCVM